jgi:hypothetical protein
VPFLSQTLRQPQRTRFLDRGLMLCNFVHTTLVPTRFLDQGLMLCNFVHTTLVLRNSSMIYNRNFNLNLYTYILKILRNELRLYRGVKLFERDYQKKRKLGHVDL